MEGTIAPGAGGLDGYNIRELKGKVYEGKIITALKFSLENLDERAVSERNNAAHPITDVLALLEWEIESLRRVPEDERRRKADFLNVLCTSASVAPYNVATTEVLDKLKGMRAELGIPDAEARRDDKSWLRFTRRRPRAVSNDELVDLGHEDLVRPWCRRRGDFR